MAKKRFVWNSEVQNVEDYREEYKELYQEEPTDNELYTFAYDNIQTELEDLFAEIATHEKHHGQKSYVVKGDIGRWDGRHDGGRVIKGMKQVILMCMEESTEVYRDGIRMKITAHHHDASNFYQIKELTPRGEKWCAKHYVERDRDVIEKLWNDRHLSAHVTLWKTLFGV